MFLMRAFRPRKGTSMYLEQVLFVQIVSPVHMGNMRLGSFPVMHPWMMVGIHVASGGGCRGHQSLRVCETS